MPLGRPDADRAAHRSAWQSLLTIGAGELILRTAILFTGGLVFHSSGLDDNGRGHCFRRPFRRGQETQVGLWSQEPGVIAMNDDRIAVRVNAGGAMCYGTPGAALPTSPATMPRRSRP